MLTQTHPNSPTAYFNLAVIYESEGNFEKAVEYYKKTIEHHPAHAGAHNNLGTLYARTGRMALAAEHWKKAVEIDPASPARTNLMMLQQGN